MLAVVQGWYRRIRSDHLLAGSSYLAANTFAVTGLGVLFWWSAARLYPPESIGLAVVAISTVQLITTAAQMGLGYGVIRFLPEAGAEAAMLLNSALTVTGGLALCLAALVVFVGPHLSPELGRLSQSGGYGVMFILMTVSLALFQLLDQMLAALRASRILLWKNMLTGLGRVGLLALASVRPSPTMVMLAFALPLVLAVAVTTLLVLPRQIAGYAPRPAFHVARLRQVSGYSANSYAGNLLHDLPYQALPHLIANQLGAASAAYFYIAWNIFSMLTTVSASVSLSLFVEGSREAGRLAQLRTRALGVALGITAAMALAVIVAADLLLGIFGPAYASGGAPALRWLALATLPAALVYLLTATQRIRKQLGSINTAFGLIALVSLLLAQLSLQRGLFMVGIVWGVAQSAAAAYLLLIRKRQTGS
ncbi:MAG: oligosaccharide flippase family protein [Chloroflexota bacterium]